MGERPLWAVAGGKGGTGKSFVASSLGLLLAADGRDVVLLDADLGTPNLHTFLGVRDGHPDLGDFLVNALPALSDAALPTGFPHLRLVKGTEGLVFAANLQHYRKLRLLRQLKTLPADFVLLDIGTGTSFNALDFFLSAGTGILVVTPEPTAVENGHAFLRACVVRILKLYLEHYRLRDLAALLAERIERNGASLYGFFEEAEARRPAFAPILQRAMKSFRPGLVVNKVRSDKDRLLGPALVDVIRKTLQVEIVCLGMIPYDDRVGACLRRTEPFVAEHPDSPAAAALAGIARRLVEQPGAAAARGLGGLDAAP